MKYLSPRLSLEKRQDGFIIIQKQFYHLYAPIISYLASNMVVRSLRLQYTVYSIYSTYSTMYIHKKRGDSNSPRFYYFCVRLFMQLSLSRPHSCSFAFSFYLLAPPKQNEMQRNGRRKKRREWETKKERLAWTAVHRIYKIRDY